MDGYDRLRAATIAMSAEELRDCVECLVLALYGHEDDDGEIVLTTDRDWSDDMVAEIMQALAAFGLHPDDLNAQTAAPSAPQSQGKEVNP